VFDANSRYAKLPTARFTRPDGTEIVYVRRRFLPKGAEMPLLVEATVQHGERIDHLTARTLGQPEQYWRVADANDAMKPADLVEIPGVLVRVPVPQV